MKNFLSSLFLLSFTLLSRAQSGWDNNVFYYDHAFQLWDEYSLLQGQPYHGQLLPQHLTQSHWINSAWSYELEATLGYNSACEIHTLLATSNGDNVANVTYNYDAQHPELESQYLSQLWDGSQWRNDHMSQYGYDQGGFSTYTGSLDWSYSNSIWDTSTFQISTNSYDVNGNISSHVIQYYSSGNFTNDYRYVYRYDGSQVLQAVDFYGWQSNNWVFHGRDTLFQFDYYNSSSDWRAHEVTQQSYNSGSWTNAKRYSLPYDQYGTFIQLEEHWDGSNWINYHLISFLHDTHSNQVSLSDKFWDYNQWITSFLDSTVIVYNVDGSMAEATSMVWNTYTQVFTNYLKDDYDNFTYCSTGINYTANSENDFSITPNLSNGEFEIQFSSSNNSTARVIIQNGYGQVVKAQTIELSPQEQSELIDLSSYADGIYYVAMMIGNKINTRKIVLVH